MSSEPNPPCATGEVGNPTAAPPLLLNAVAAAYLRRLLGCVKMKDAERQHKGTGKHSTTHPRPPLYVVIDCYITQLKVQWERYARKHDQSNPSRTKQRQRNGKWMIPADADRDDYCRLCLRETHDLDHCLIMKDFQRCHLDEIANVADLYKLNDKMNNKDDLSSSHDASPSADANNSNNTCIKRRNGIPVEIPHPIAHLITLSELLPPEGGSSRSDDDEKILTSIHRTLVEFDLFIEGHHQMFLPMEDDIQTAKNHAMPLFVVVLEQFESCVRDVLWGPFSSSSSVPSSSDGERLITTTMFENFWGAILGKDFPKPQTKYQQQEISNKKKKSFFEQFTHKSAIITVENKLEIGAPSPSAKQNHDEVPMRDIGNLLLTLRDTIGHNMGGEKNSQKGETCTDKPMTSKIAEMLKSFKTHLRPLAEVAIGAPNQPAPLLLLSPTSVWSTIELMRSMMARLVYIACADVAKRNGGVLGDLKKKKKPADFDASLLQKVKTEGASMPFSKNLTQDVGPVVKFLKNKFTVMKQDLCCVTDEMWEKFKQKNEHRGEPLTVVWSDHYSNLSEELWITPDAPYPKQLNDGHDLVCAHTCRAAGGHPHLKGLWALWTPKQSIHSGNGVTPSSAAAADKRRQCFYTASDIYLLFCTHRFLGGAASKGGGGGWKSNQEKLTSNNLSPEDVVPLDLVVLGSSGNINMKSLAALVEYELKPLRVFADPSNPGGGGKGKDGSSHNNNNERQVTNTDPWRVLNHLSAVSGTGIPRERDSNRLSSAANNRRQRMMSEDLSHENITSLLDTPHIHRHRAQNLLIDSALARRIQATAAAAAAACSPQHPTTINCALAVITAFGIFDRNRMQLEASFAKQVSKPPQPATTKRSDSSCDGSKSKTYHLQFFIRYRQSFFIRNEDGEADEEVDIVEALKQHVYEQAAKALRGWEFAQLVVESKAWWHRVLFRYELYYAIRNVIAHDPSDVSLDTPLMDDIRRAIEKEGAASASTHEREKISLSRPEFFGFPNREEGKPESSTISADLYTEIDAADAKMFDKLVEWVRLRKTTACGGGHHNSALLLSLSTSSSSSSSAPIAPHDGVLKANYPSPSSSSSSSSPSPSSATTAATTTTTTTTPTTTTVQSTALPLHLDSSEVKIMCKGFLEIIRTLSMCYQLECERDSKQLIFQPKGWALVNAPRVERLDENGAKVREVVKVKGLYTPPTYFTDKNAIKRSLFDFKTLDPLGVPVIHRFPWSADGSSSSPAPKNDISGGGGGGGGSGDSAADSHHRPTASAVALSNPTTDSPLSAGSDASPPRTTAPPPPPPPPPSIGVVVDPQRRTTAPQHSDLHPPPPPTREGYMYGLSSSATPFQPRRQPAAAAAPASNVTASISIAGGGGAGNSTIAQFTTIGGRGGLSVNAPPFHQRPHTALSTEATDSIAPLAATAAVVGSGPRRTLHGGVHQFSSATNPTPPQ